jgi:Tfp pilus assembly protein PilO
MMAATQNILDEGIRRFGRILHYAGLLSAVAGVTASYSLLHAPLIREMERTNADINELTLSIQNAAAVRDQHEKVSERLAAAKEQIATVRKRVPQDADSGQFFDEVSKIAADASLSIKNYEPTKAVVKDGYAQMEVTLTGRGNYASICSFFDRLANLTRLSKLQNLTLTASGDAAEYPLTATMIIYFGLRGKEAKSTKEVKRG